MFRGTFQHSIDEKGRTSLPAKFREVLSARSEEKLVVTQAWPDKCLWCQPPAAWIEIEQKIAAMPQFNPDVRRLTRAFISPAQDVPFDKLGRVLIPPALREYAELKGDVIWAGAINRIELWNADTWKQKQTEGQDDEALARSFGNL